MEPSFQHWSDAATTLRARGEGFVLVTVLQTRGSTPRDGGTKMLVSVNRCVGTIGGGQLEYAAIQQARNLLLQGKEQQLIEDFPLGAKLGQCCGGHVSILFEAFAHGAVTVALFGAGHVGRALASILAQLPVRLLWIDSRADEFPTELPAGAHGIVEEYPQDYVTQLPPGSYVVAMTHQHPLDYAIAEAALNRGDTAYLGVIGSSTKAKRFRLRLQRRGFSQQQIDHLHCPVGLDAVTGKHPMEVAVSVAGQIISLYQEQMALTAEHQGEKFATLLPNLLPVISGLETNQKATMHEDNKSENTQQENTSQENAK